MIRRCLLTSFVLAVLAVGVNPVAAQAWKVEFNDFFGIYKSAFAAAKKCHGGPVGEYRYRSTALADAVDDSNDLRIEVDAELSARPKWRQMQGVDVSIQAGDSFDQATIDETLRAVTDFHDTLVTRYRPKKHKLDIDHDAFVIFGQTTLEPGQETIKFKPKKGC